MITLYGITNCSTVKKARNWLESNGNEYTFHDYKKLGIDTAHLQKWCKEFGWELVLNRQGMMWRKADIEQKNKVIDEQSAITFMLHTPNAIKRPIIEFKEKLIRGFDEEEYKTIFK